MTAEPASVGTQVNPNTLNDRQAMGLPRSFVAGLAEHPLAGHRNLLGLDPDRLAVIVESPREPFGRRHAAGTLLGLLGDPRIGPVAPAMVDVPGGDVRIGLDIDDVADVVARWRHTGVVEPWIVKECPRHTVHIEPFRIMRYPVTTVEYRRFLADTGATWLPTSWRFGCYPTGVDNHPVWSVQPEAADAYAAWLAVRTGRRFRLPTEAEWELAASGGDGRQYPWGAEFVSSAANTLEQGLLTTTPVGLYPQGRSPFGVDDMAGNVEELVADDYRPYPGGRRIDDDLARHGSYRIARGGSFTRYGDLARCGRRHGYHTRLLYACGFRLAETL